MMAMSEFFKRLENLPVRQFPCASCIHLRLPESEKMAENYMICGWWDKVKWPLRGVTWQTPGLPRHPVYIERKRIYDGPFEGITECAQLENRARSSGKGTHADQPDLSKVVLP